MMLRTQLREGRHPYANGAVIDAELPRLLGDLLHSGGKSVQAVDDMKIDLAGFAPNQAANRGIARPQSCVKVGELGLRFDHNALPSAFVEPERHVVGDWVPRAHVDIGSGFLAREGER